MKANILVVDDEPEIADLVSVYLRGEGFQVFPCGTGTEALQVVRNEKIDLAVLDVMLPDISGMTLCAEIRRTCQFPILMLTAKTADTDKITGLTVGADDYMTKPFSPLELVARVKAQLRRYTSYNNGEKEGEDVLNVSGLTINKTTHQCWLYDEPMSLTPIEFDILWFLCANRGRVISAEELFETVWGEKYLDRNNTVMVHIRRLREKLGETSDRKFIKTVWGVGYKVE
ncbi:MAG: VanR-ABDEGLN family response regulator transcription factor [Oscillospiraceae bacterium]|nr:VanR-ABDEGLN family response regulator transcription factor [Oscillospiraceae bacterium]